MQMADSCNPILGLASFLGSNSVIDESTMIAPLGFGNSGYERGMPELRYMKAAQQLLDEVVNVSEVSDRLPDESCDENKSEILKEGEDGDPKDDPGPNAKESANRSSKLSDSERVELQDKLSRLISMLEEVDKRYDQYYNQMQIVKQSFDAMAGSDASKPYTALALRRISHQFRCLRDAITGQIHANRKRLGEGDDAPKTRLSRLRHIDQRLMQRRAAQQLGMMQQESWRPHRGLPESSVSALRAWLFEHFLHPYPKDSDKALLARQTGLTRGQVSNWFINARVRLWKPMVEEIYKEEMGGLEQELDSLYENVAVVSKSEEKCRDLEKAACSEDCPVRELDTDVAEGSADFQEGNHQDARNTEHDTGRVRSAVSVSLGLQHQEGGRLPLPEARHLSMVAMGSDSFYDTPRSSAAAKAIDPGNQQRTVPSSHQLMHDFVA